MTQINQVISSVQEAVDHVNSIDIDNINQAVTSIKDAASKLEKLDIEGKNILLVDDIFDTGHTLCSLSKAMLERGAKTVRTCALLDKPSRREVVFDIDYRGFTIENLFVVGYGLDYAEEYRTLPDVCYFPEAK